MLEGFRFHHLGVATKKLDAAIRVYESLGYTLHLQTTDEPLGVHAAFLRGDGPWVELVSPIDEAGGPLKSLLKRGALPTPYHTCYAVEDLSEASALLRKRGFLVLGKPSAAVAFDGALIQYHAHSAIGLVELVEKPPF